jgi:hypothetical protein
MGIAVALNMKVHYIMNRIPSLGVFVSVVGALAIAFATYTAVEEVLILKIKSWWNKTF